MLELIMLRLLCQNYYNLTETPPFVNITPLQNIEYDETLISNYDYVNFLCLTPIQKAAYWFYNSCFSRDDVSELIRQTDADESIVSAFYDILSVMEHISSNEALSRNTKYYTLKNTNIKFIFNNFIPTMLNSSYRGTGFKVKPIKTNTELLPNNVDHQHFYNLALDFYHGRVESCRRAPLDIIPCSIGITGTACLGKSTILDKLQSKYNIKLLKSSVRGGIKQKDGSIYNASNFQLGVMCDMLMNPFALYDRCFLDNMLWRIIMAMFDMDRDSALRFAILSLASLNKTIYEFCRSIPLYIIISNDISKTRKMMISRNSCSDFRRALLENYVEYQNVVYGLFAKFANIPLYTNDDLEFVGECIENNIANRHVVMNLGNVNETFKIKEEYQIVNSDSDQKYFKVAETVKILK